MNFIYYIKINKKWKFRKTLRLAPSPFFGGVAPCAFTIFSLPLYLFFLIHNTNGNVSKIFSALALYLFFLVHNNNGSIPKKISARRALALYLFFLICIQLNTMMIMIRTSMKGKVKRKMKKKKMMKMMMVMMMMIIGVELYFQLFVALAFYTFLSTVNQLTFDGFLNKSGISTSAINALPTPSPTFF